jgi:hypothetical protein
MISDFDQWTLANMEIALERACANIPGAQKHRARRYIAHRIIRCARKGGRTLESLLRAGEIAAAELRKRATAKIEAGPLVSGTEGGKSSGSGTAPARITEAIRSTAH